MNRVDRLRQRIETIQQNCQHDFRLVKEPKLKESLVKGVFVGSASGPTAMGASETEMTLVCLNCSKQKMTDITTTCPRCLAPMGKPDRLGAESIFSRKKYFGQDYVYYSVEVARCTKCNFAVASDWWNQ